MNQFNHFVQQIPDDVYCDADVYMGEQVALFKPKAYIAKELLFSEDYHIVLPSDTPPPTVIGRREYEFSKGKLIVFNPQTEVYCRNTILTHQYSSIAIKRELLSKVAEDMGFHRNVVFKRVENPYSDNLLRAVYCFECEIKSYGGSSQLMVDSISIQIAAIILRELESNINTAKVSAPSCDCYIKNAMDLMNVFFSSNLSIEDMCRTVHVTPFHFIRLFKEKTGMTPHEYLLNVRINNAMDIIKKYEYPISEVAKMCGFVNAGHFSSVFKRMTGISPSEFRKS